MELAGTQPRWGEPELEASLDIRSPRIASLMLRLADEIARPGFASNLMVEAVTMEIGLELLRYRQDMSEAKSPGLAQWRLRVIEERLEEDSAPSLTELATLCSLSARQLARGFRFSRSQSLGRYVAERRLAKAKHRLLLGESVKSVAYSMGFSSPTAFCKAFRRHLGLTPGQFKDAGKDRTI
jgi:AraC family transcriptional regulator